MSSSPWVHGRVARWSLRCRRLLQEPLVHFVCAGLALFVAGEAHRAGSDANRIVLTPEREAHLAARYELQFGTQPDAQTLAQLIERDIDEEMLFRRGLALELDRNDEIVRRRIVQKMRFLLEDVSAPGEPDDADLETYYQAHAAKYVAPARITFSHVYFANGEGERSARDRASRALDQLSSGRVPPTEQMGDPFPDRYHFAAYEPEQLYRLFGRTEFSAAAQSAPLERWMGPYRSAYGWHLVRVEARSEAQQLDLATVRDRVRTDYLLDVQARTNAAAFEAFAAEFTVVRERW